MTQQGRLGIILSMKDGLASFNYWELRSLARSGVPFRVYPTKRSRGPYVPDESWSVATIGPLKVLWLGLTAFFKTPGRATHVLALALRFRALMDAWLALAYSLDMREFRIERVHVHFGDRKLSVAYFIHLLTGLPYSVVIHAHELYRNPNLALATKALLLAARIFTVSDYNVGLLESKFKVSRSRIAVIGLPFDVSLLNVGPPPVKDSVGILSIGRNVPKKGFDVLLEAVGRMPSGRFELEILGKGTEKLQQLADRLGIADRVRLVGEVPLEVLRREIAAADVFCLASRTSPHGDAEGLPIAIVEAMAAGRAVVSTNHAGIPELLGSQVVSEGDPDQLARALTRLVVSDSARASEGKANRTRIISFHLPRISDYLRYLGAESGGLLR